MGTFNINNKPGILVKLRTRKCVNRSCGRLDEWSDCPYLAKLTKWQSLFLKKMKLILNIEPKPQSRPRLAVIKGRASAYEKNDMRLWRQNCALLVRNLWKGKKYDTALKVRATFYIKPTKQLLNTKYKRQMLEAETIPVATLPDTDNYIKSLFDSISDAGCVWKDDGRVSEIWAKKVYSLNPRIEVEIEELE